MLAGCTCFDLNYSAIAAGQTGWVLEHFSLEPYSIWFGSSGRAAIAAVAREIAAVAAAAAAVPVAGTFVAVVPAAGGAGVAGGAVAVVEWESRWAKVLRQLEN